MAMRAILALAGAAAFKPQHQPQRSRNRTPREFGDELDLSLAFFPRRAGRGTACCPLACANRQKVRSSMLVRARARGRSVPPGPTLDVEVSPGE